SPGMSYQGMFFGEVNLMYSKYYIGHGGITNWGPRLGIESNFRKDDYVYAPKIGYEFSSFIFIVRSNAIGYINSRKLDLRILPEAGFSLFGALNLAYGYSLSFLEHNTHGLT